MPLYNSPQAVLGAAFESSHCYENLNHYTVANRLRYLLRELGDSHELTPTVRYDLALALCERRNIPSYAEAGTLLRQNLTDAPAAELTMPEILSWVLYIQIEEARRAGLSNESCIRTLEDVFEALRGRGEHRLALIVANMVHRLAPRRSRRSREAITTIREYVYWPRMIPLKARLLALATMCGHNPRLRLTTDHLKG